MEVGVRVNRRGIDVRRDLVERLTNERIEFGAVPTTFVGGRTPVEVPRTNRELVDDENPGVWPSSLTESVVLARSVGRGVIRECSECLLGADSAVVHFDLAVGVCGDVGVVGDHDDGGAVGVQALEEFEEVGCRG